MSNETLGYQGRPEIINDVEQREEKMLKGQNMVYFGPEKWDGLWRNRHQIMSRFAICNKVIYVEPRIYLKKLRRDLNQGTLRFKDLWSAIRYERVTKKANGLYIYHSPIFVPVSERYPLNRITWWAWKFVLKLTLRRLGFHKPIIWLSKPDMAHFIESFNEKMAIYHVVDEYLGYGDVDSEVRPRLEVLEQQMLEKADIVIVVSNKLLETKGVFNTHTYVVPNGVDYQAYDRALRSDKPLPYDVARLAKPVIGYSGLISRRLDLDLIHYIASTHPDWSLALLGAVSERWCEYKLSQLRQMNNVYFLGMKDIKQVPYYVKAFDVCFIPYVINEETENLSPLKLYDFMATGKPIVTTDFPAVQEFRDVIYINDSKKNFTHSIENALLENNNGLFNDRRRVASLNTWDHRVNELSRLIQYHLSGN